MAVYVLSDGIEIHTSTQGRTGLLGATFSDKWAMGTWDKLFSACTNQPTDPKVFARLKAQKRTSLHLGKYSYAAEAAYVIARYKEDPIAVIDLVQEEQEINGADAGVPNNFFPTDLYDENVVPVFFSHNEALELVKRVAAARDALKTIDHRMVNENRGVMGKKYKSGIFQTLAATYGKETVHRDIQKLTINEFQLRYGLRV